MILSLNLGMRTEFVIFASMKRILTALAALLIALSANAQPAGVQIITRKEKLSDFTTKVTKAVLTGNDFFDAGFKDAVKDAWMLSPYEFCTRDEYNALKKDGSYYFLVVTDREREPGILFLTLVKGDDDDLAKMTQVAELPVCPEGAFSGREAIYMPALLDVMQRYVERSMVSNFASIGAAVQGLGKATRMKVFLDEGDLSAQVNGKLRAKMLDKQVYVVPESESEDVLLAGGNDTLVGYTVSSSASGKGAVCYKMLFDARTHELYYYTKHAMTASKGAGFLRADVGKILSGR